MKHILPTGISGIFAVTCVAVLFGTLVPIGFNLGVINAPSEVELFLIA